MKNCRGITSNQNNSKKYNSNNRKDQNSKTNNLKPLTSLRIKSRHLLRIWNWKMLRKVETLKSSNKSTWNYATESKILTASWNELLRNSKVKWQLSQNRVPKISWISIQTTCSGLDSKKLRIQRSILRQMSTRLQKWRNNLTV